MKSPAPIATVDAGRAHSRRASRTMALVGACVVVLLGAAARSDTAVASGGAVMRSSDAAPALTIEMLQTIDGTNAPYTTAGLTGKVGQEIDYELIVKNISTVPLSFGALKDANCQGIAGGPAKALANGESATYTCHRTLSGPGAFENTASITASPPEGEGQPITRSSNTVVASVPYEPAFTIEVTQRLHGGADPFTRGQLTGQVGQTIDYEILIENTGNAAMTFSSFSASACDRGTVSGGPGAASVPPGQLTAYYCTHVLSVADQAAGTYHN
jgi:hypothetical protein